MLAHLVTFLYSHNMQAWTALQPLNTTHDVLAAVVYPPTTHTLLACLSSVSSLGPACLLVHLHAGLDSFAALNVMGYLQDFARAKQQTVVATIHQPRSAIWEMFDTVSS